MEEQERDKFECTYIYVAAFCANGLKTIEQKSQTPFYVDT